MKPRSGRPSASISTSTSTCPTPRESDKVADTVSYDKVAECAREAFCGQRFRLIEAVAGKVADAILATFARVQSVSVTIHKPHAPIAATFSDVGVTLRRTANRRCVMSEALLALGGNVGNSRAILDRAVTLLCDGIDVRLKARSSDYLTQPWGLKYQAPFVNLCIAVDTALSAARSAGARPRRRAAASAATAPMRSAGARAPPTSTSSPMTTSPWTNSV